MSWGFLCSLNLPTYPNLVRKFYGIITRGSGGFHCKLRGIDVIVNKELLSRVPKISSIGGTTTIHSDREGALNLIFDTEDINTLKEILASQLLVQMRLLHSIIAGFYFQRLGDLILSQRGI